MPPFTKAYGFYVLMGGLAVNVVHLHDYLQDVVLTPNGILELARKGHFFHVSDAYINDKSKANLLAKGLVLLQITWTVMQCLSRKVAGLPLSILEVHTLVHAGCALIIYALWFNKPFDVDQPVMVQHGIPDEIAALMLVRNYKFGMYPVGNLLPPSGFRRAKRSGSRYGIWLSGLASESTYLVYNPNLGEGSGSTNLSLYSANGPEQGISNSHVGFTIQSAVIKNKSTAKDASTETQPEDLEQPSAVDSAGILPRTIDSLRPGVKIDTTLSTGDFLTGGIGPNAYAIGEWDDALRARPPHTQPSRVKPIPEGLRDKLPLHQVDHSSVKYYCSMNISLSPKDVRRWQLAGAALRKELPITLSPQKEKPLLNFESSGGSFRGAYFYISQGLFGRTKGNKGGVVEGSWRDPHNFQAHVEAWQRVYHNCLNFEVLNLGSTSAVTMLPGLLYGVFHLALWNYVFPSQAERLMWRMSGIVLIAVPVLLAVALMLRTGFQRYTPSQVSQPPDPHLPTTTAAAAATATADYRASTTVLQEGEIDSEAAVSAADIRENDGGGVQQGDTAGMNIPLPQALLLEAAAYLTVLTGALYVFSRFFIIVESFISLRHVPVGVYTDVGWSKYIPHF